MVDGDKDYRPVLREHADKIFAVTINGAKLGSKTWTNGLIQPLDQGDFDNRQLLATLREIGYRGPDRADVLRHPRRRPRASRALDEDLEETATLTRKSSHFSAHAKAGCHAPRLPCVAKYLLRRFGRQVLRVRIVPGHTRIHIFAA